ncbi:MAG: NUDIX hydrolase [Acidiferrobacterales bacterium]
MKKDISEAEAPVYDMLKADYQYLAESFWKNEQTGETRVNLFIGLGTLVVGALASLLTGKHVELNAELKFIIAGSMFSLIVLGIVTLLRILIRNQHTDEYIRGMDHIRQKVKDYNYTWGLLEGYYPFGKTVLNTVAIHTPHPVRKERFKVRRFGGLAHTIAAINSLLFGTSVGVILYSPQPSLIALTILVAFAFLVSLIAQIIYISRRELASKAKIEQGEYSHAGGIVYRRENEEVLFLLVQAKGNPNEWVLPKGHIERNEGHGEAAIREVIEETGVRATILCPVGQLIFRINNNEQIRTKIYLMKYLFQGQALESRKIQWLPLDKALETVTYENTRTLLMQAEQLL